MAFHSLFIGVGKYVDPDIPELVGATRDAKALHALFSDAVADPKPILLLDADATTHNVHRELETLQNTVGPDDTAVVYFSGHGSHDHRLAMHDTSYSDFSATTVSMQDVADFFRNSRARSVLCVLDCCFSGGAPAKVLENSPIPRDPIDPFEGIVGEGRLLLTACAIDEVAYESPITRHGVLTKAVLDLLLDSKTDINLLTAMDEVLQRVRAEAAKMGIVQTPTLLGSVQGGLVLPKLTRGKHFDSAFPEYAGLRISRSIDHLLGLGIPSVVTQAWAARYPGGLNDLQLSAVNDYRITEGASLVVVAPTSSGKTFIGEIAAAKAISEGRKSVFLFPYRALVNEKFDQFSALYGEQLGMRVLRCTGDYSDEAGAFVRGKYELAVLTYEMFLQLVLTFPRIRNQLGLVVVDEAQFITDPTRGINVELLLTFLLGGREIGVSPQLIALSAVIGNANSFHDWLGCGLLMSDQRPVPLVEGVVDRNGTYQYMDIDGTPKQEQVVPSREIVMRKGKPSAQDLLVPLVRSLVAKNEKVIIFRNQRGFAQGCASYLARDLGLAPAAEIANQLPDSDNSAASRALRTCLNGGTAFHTTNLTREERVVVERGFRDPDSRIRVLAATTTVAAGINTPASTVILAEQEFVGDDGRPFTVAEYKNMAGRAGRLGFQEKGKSIIYAETATERSQLFRKYVEGTLESLHSSFHGSHLDTWILRLLAQVPGIARTEVVRLLANTYAGYLENRRDPSWRSSMGRDVENLLQRMTHLGLLEVEGDLVRLTLLGRACGCSSLSFVSALRLVEFMRSLNGQPVSAENMVALVQLLEEAEAYTPMLPGNKESVRVGQAAQRYGNNIVALLQRYATSSENYWARCKRAAVLFDWMTGVKVEVIESHYSTTPYRGRIELGDIRRFADTTRFVLRSAGEILALVLPGADVSEQLDLVLDQLEVGIPGPALQLLKLPVALPRGQYLDLHAAGISTLASFWNAGKDRLKALLSERVLAALEKKRPADYRVARPSGDRTE